VAAGTVGYPLPRFSAFVLIGGTCWATFAGLIGYFAGAAFGGNHLLAVSVGVGLGVGIGLLGETLRMLRKRAPARKPHEEAPSSPAVE
jgi:membrane protein DedA with SNARE-associated domain